MGRAVDSGAELPCLGHGVGAHLQLQVDMDGWLTFICSTSFHPPPSQASLGGCQLPAAHFPHNVSLSTGSPTRTDRQSPSHFLQTPPPCPAAGPTFSALCVGLFWGLISWALLVLGHWHKCAQCALVERAWGWRPRLFLHVSYLDPFPV